jgi:cysteine synthase
MVYENVLQMIDNMPMVKINRIVKEEGIFVGMSNSAAMLVTAKIADKIKSGNIVTIFPDRGEKYLSTTLFG